MEQERDLPFTSAMALAIVGSRSIPQRYILPPHHRPNATLSDHPSAVFPVIDLSLLDHPSNRPKAIDEIRSACMKLGFFQVINHGIPVSVIDDALHTANEFFHLTSEEKMRLASSNVHDPVRYGTSLNHATDKIFCWRDFIKHYANPISDWVHLWPANPKNYREKMGRYAKAVHVLQNQLMGAIIESLGLSVNYLKEDIENDAQLLVVNCYPSCPNPDLALGMPAHTDYGTITILNQSQQGLEIMDHDKTWHPVPFIHGALIVQLGDQMEIMSNGRYKGTIHRATVNMERIRLSIASIHSLSMETKVGPIPELVDDKHPIAYREGSFSEFLDHISSNSLSGTKYIDLKRIR